MSLTAFLHKHNASVGQDIQISESLLEFGAGFRYHFSQSPSMTNVIIPYGLFDFGFGTITLTNTVESGGNTTPSSIKGTNRFFSVGAGAKYILQSGWGFKSVIDYYSSNEEYAYSSTTGTRSLAGFRIQAGLSYRF